MSEAMWVWDYELKTLGSWPSTGYNGHNTPVEVVTQMDVKTLRDERDRLRRALEQVSFHLAQPGDDETPHNQYVPSAAEVGTCQVIILAALTPAAGGTRHE